MQLRTWMHKHEVKIRYGCTVSHMQEYNAVIYCIHGFKSHALDQGFERARQEHTEAWKLKACSNMHNMLYLV